MRSDVLFWLVMALIVGGAGLLVVTDSSGSVFGIPSGRFAGVLYMGVWALVLAAALVGSRFRRAHMLRNATIWLAIIVLLVAAYQYRPLVEGWLGMSEPVNPASQEPIKFESNEDYI